MARGKEQNRPTDTESSSPARQRTIDSRTRQGLPPSVEDPVALTRIAELLDRDAEDIDWPEVERAHRRNRKQGGDR